MTVNNVLSHAIRQESQPLVLPDGEELQILTIRAVEAFSTAEGTSLLDVEKAALEQDILPERYVRNHSLLSLNDQYTLLCSKVFVVGLGGLGGHVVELLARLGVGTIVGADGDFFEPTNLNRTIECHARYVGREESQMCRASSASCESLDQFYWCRSFFAWRCTARLCEAC